MVVDIRPDPPFYALTEDDQAALVVVASLIFLIYAIVGISLKLIIRLNITSLKSHDVILLVATGLLLSQTLCIIIACNHGLGHHQDVVKPYDLEAFHKVCSPIARSEVEPILTKNHSSSTLPLYLRLRLLLARKFRYASSSTPSITTDD